MTVFTDFVGYNRMSYNDTFRSSPLFVTYGTQLYDFIRTSNVPQSQLAARQSIARSARQRRERRVNDRVVEVVAPTQSIIRPERDPSVTNPTSSVAFPAGTSQTYQTFFYNTLVDSKYVLPPGNVPFPFTQLGYTYDWNNPANIHGLAEFVILSPKSPNPVNGASVTGITQVNSVVSLLSYRYYDHQGNFDIQGDVDTVWAGTRYVPQGAYVTVDPARRFTKALPFHPAATRSPTAVPFSGPEKTSTARSATRWCSSNKAGPW